MDSELLATQRIIKILGALDAERREHVLDFVARRFQHDRWARERAEKMTYGRIEGPADAVPSMPMTLAGTGAVRGY